MDIMEATSSGMELRELEREMAIAFDWTEWRGPYLPLPTPTSIRLLFVAPKEHEDPAESIRCSLSIVDLNDVPVYSALSYTWGNPRGLLPPGEDVEADREANDTKYPILCNGHVIDVTANCHAFLQQFRGLQRLLRITGHAALETEFGLSGSNTFYIWIDAICINQDSMAERTAQVRIMDRVYRQAAHVFIWLGLPDELTQEGFELMTHLARMRHKTKGMSRQMVSSIAGDIYESPLLKKYGLPSIRHRQWQALLSLFRRQWFLRSWTAQEYALARSAPVMCGDKVTKMLNWHRALHFLISTPWLAQLAAFESPKGLHYSPEIAQDSTPGHELIVIHESRERFEMPICRLGDLQALQSRVSVERWTNADNTFPLQRVLDVARTSLSSLPVDRIYAYLGLVPEASWQGLSIDYSRSTAETYLQAALAMIKSTKSLSILSFVEDSALRRAQGLPSWVPDYTQRHSIRYLDPGSKDKFAGLPPGRFECTNGSQYDFEANDMLCRILHVIGACYGLVSEISISKSITPSLPDSHFHLEQSDAVLNCIPRLPQNCFWRTLFSDEDMWESSYPASDRSAKTIFSIWITALVVRVSKIEEIMSVSLASAAELEQGLNELRKTLKAYLMLSGDKRFFDNVKFENDVAFVPSFETMRAYIVDAADGLLPKPCDDMTRTDLEVIVSRVHYSLDVHMSNRVLFVTSDQQLGKGPASMQSGDQVWLLRGAKVPYILRPLGLSKYELVGEAYIHGIMQGEAWTDDSESLTTITLV